MRRLYMGLVGLSFMATTPAQGAGLYLAPPGVAPLAQAGALVARTADVHALVYNPAGLCDAQPQWLLDGAHPHFTSSFSRTVTANSPVLPVVHGHSLTPISPNMGAVFAPKGKYWPRLGAMVATDYPLIQTWPDPRRFPTTPQRYATGGFARTLLVKGIMGAGYAVRPWLHIGMSLQAQIGTLQSLATLSTCDGVVCTQAENPDYDATVALRAPHVLLPGVNVGLGIRPWRAWRFGFSYASGTRYEGGVDLRLTLPRAPMYQGATVSPAQPRGRLHFALPPTVRAGVAFAPRENVEMELAAAYVPWHVHRNMRVTQADVTVEHLVGLGRFAVPDVTLARGLVDTLSWHLGGAWRLVGCGKGITLRGGVMMEPSAVPQAMLTAMTVDLPKRMASLGAAYRRGTLEIAGTYAILLMRSQHVTQSATYQINPTQPEGSTQVTAVGNGYYQGLGQVFGLSLRYLP
jgi:long-subunit fatty acid transport protein